MQDVELQGKTILITGGTGSFGNAFITRVKDTNFKEVRIFSRDEKKQHDLRIKLNDERFKFYLGDVRSPESIDLATKGVDYVFQAAALKQVPSCEFFPLEATKTNVIGTNNVLNACIKNQVKSVVCLSTDKAAYPINAMGMSKALMEKVVISNSNKLQDEDTRLCLTRYGNVMASRGSVIPLFIEQIKKGEEITITNPEMTRYLMSLDEAIDLVFFAFNNGNNGDLFVQKSPASTIINLAKAILELFEADNGVKIIGTRHGEKLYETLCTKEEMVKVIDLGDFYKIPPDTRSLNYNNYFDDGNIKVSETEDYNSNNTTQLSIEEVMKKLLEVEYVKSELNKWNKKSK